MTKGIKIVEDRINNIYVLHNVDFPTLTSLIAASNKSLLWHRKLGHVSMHSLEKLSGLELVIGVPKLKFEKTLYLTLISVVSKLVLHSR